MIALIFIGFCIGILILTFAGYAVTEAIVTYKNAKRQNNW